MNHNRDEEQKFIQKITHTRAWEKQHAWVRTRVDLIHSALSEIIIDLKQFNSLDPKSLNYIEEQIDWEETKARSKAAERKIQFKKILLSQIRDLSDSYDGIELMEKLKDFFNFFGHLHNFFSTQTHLIQRIIQLEKRIFPWGDSLSTVFPKINEETELRKIQMILLCSPLADREDVGGKPQIWSLSKNCELLLKNMAVQLTVETRRVRIPNNPELSPPNVISCPAVYAKDAFLPFPSNIAQQEKHYFSRIIDILGFLPTSSGSHVKMTSMFVPSGDLLAALEKAGIAERNESTKERRWTLNLDSDTLFLVYLATASVFRESISRLLLSWICTIFAYILYRQFLLSEPTNNPFNSFLNDDSVLQTIFSALIPCVALVLGSANWYQQSPRGRKTVGELIASFGTLLDEEFDQCILFLSHVY